MLAYPFMVNAFRAGTIVAVLAGVVGWFTVVRRDAFAAHTLSVLGFPGAAGALAFGLRPAVGLYAACTAGACALGGDDDRQRGRTSRPASIAVVQTAALGVGHWFASLYRGNAADATALLFGTFLGVTETQVVVLMVVALCVVGVIALIARPLLLVSLDPVVAEARGAPVRVLRASFTVMVGITVAAVSQISGSLLVFALLVLPAAAAQRLSARPTTSLLLAVLLAVGITWGSLALAFETSWPIGFVLTTLGIGSLLVVTGAQRIRTIG